MINWRVRVRNKMFWLSLIPACLLFAQVVAAPLGVTLVTDDLNNQLLAIVNALFGLLTLLGIVTDPTTEGVSDSLQALGYSEPKDDISTFHTPAHKRG